jgi:hypothetical protein
MLVVDLPEKKGKTAIFLDIDQLPTIISAICHKQTCLVARYCPLHPDGHSSSSDFLCRVFLCQVVDRYCQVKQLSHPYYCPVNNETEIEMTEVRFKVIERSSAEKVIEVAVMLIERGYKPVAEIMKMPNTGLFTQVMHWEPQYRTPNR